MNRFASTFALRLAVSGFALAAGFGAAVAQTGQVAAPPAVATSKPSLSAAHLALATEVVRLSGMARSIETLVPETLAKARQLFTQTRPEIAAELDKSMKALEPEFVKLREESLRLAGEAFGGRLSEAELKDIEAFYKSAAGQKFVSSQPAIMEDMFRSLDAFNLRLGQVVVDKLREDMKKKGIDL